MPDFLVRIFGQVQTAHAPWRYTMMSGLIPAIPLIVIRPFLPESPAWRDKKRAGTLQRPSIAAIFSPELRRTTIVTTLMVAAVYGVAFGAIQQMPDIVPGLADVKDHVASAKEKAAEKSKADAAKEGKTPEPKDIGKASALAGKAVENLAASEYTKLQEIGGLIGRFVFAMLAAAALSQRWLLRKFQIPGMIVVPLVFYLFLKIPNRQFFEIDLDAIYLGKLPITTMSLGMFLAGFFTVAQFSFWGNYLPRVYPMHLRGTGESFAANVGGRMIGTSFAAITATLAGEHFFGEDPSLNFAMIAAGVALAVYVIGFLLSFALPEPKRDMKE
jgi:MFS family permease